MKYILILSLLFAFSCTTKKTDKTVEASDTSSAPAGESNAQVVSPYTVKPCYCMKIFKPVCASGVNYGNSCEAECQGNKTWTEGKCTKK